MSLLSLLLLLLLSLLLLLLLSVHFIIIGSLQMFFGFDLASISTCSYYGLQLDYHGYERGGHSGTLEPCSVELMSWKQF